MPPKKQMGVALGDALRAELEKSAAERGHSIAEEIRRRLDESYDYDAQDAPTRSLMDAIGRFAELVRLQTGRSWHEHPAANRVMRHAITSRLARLRPPGEDEFNPNELPRNRLVAADNTEAMGQGLEAIAMQTPIKKRTAEERREQFEKVKAEIKALEKKGSKK
jgi:hypothetical protein